MKSACGATSKCLAAGTLGNTGHLSVPTSSGVSSGYTSGSITDPGYTPQGHVIIFTPAGEHDTRGMLSEMTADDYFEYLMEELVRRQLQLEYLSRKHNRLSNIFFHLNCFSNFSFVVLKSF